MTGTDKEYYFGLDIGTNSVGWAVTDKEYNIIDRKGKALWGVHLFESGETAAKRRTYRCARRRLVRRKQRVALLRDLFNSEISKFDVGFFERLDESGLHQEDRKSKQKNSLFNDDKFNDKAYFKKFPTVFHLRKHLMESKEKNDIRLVFLAVQHIIKNRGHFLFKNVSDEDIPPFETVMDLILDNLRDEYEFSIETPEYGEVKEVMTNSYTNLSEKKRKLNAVFGAESREKEFVTLLVGGKADMKKMFDDESLDGIKFSFKDGNFETNFLENEDRLGDEKTYTIRLVKQAFDWAILSTVLKDASSISEAKVKDFEQHKKDLKSLKKAIKKYATEKYNEVFKSSDIKGNYCSYSYVCGKGKPDKKCNQEDFCKYLRKIFEKTAIKEDSEFTELVSRYENNVLCPLQISKENAVLPYTVHRKELKVILENASEHYPFLSKKGADSLTVSEKILLLHEFRIPYYVGPLDDRSERAWIVRNTMESVKPWNLEAVVDLNETSEKFIDNLTSYCSFLAGEKVLPKQSILYSRFQLLNELNNLTVNGERVDAKTKRKIFEDLFLNLDKPKKVTEATLKKYLKVQGKIEDGDQLGGFDKDIKSTLKSEIFFRNILGKKATNLKMVEEIIRIITIFGEETGRIRKKIKSEFSDILSDEEIKSISRMRFSGWGNLSKKLLVGLRGSKNSQFDGESIIQVMENTSMNLSEIVYSESFKGVIREYNESLTSSPSGKLSYDLIKETYASPSVKRSVWRALRIMDEIISVMGCPPKKVFVETTRSEGEKVRKKSRKENLLLLLKACKETEWLGVVENIAEANLRSNKLYLYITQLGKCMYCGKNIDLSEIANNELYDRDHIYPKSKIKDDSVHNNLVLVCKSHNMEKTDNYPLDATIRREMQPFWIMLKDKKLITGEKYSRLIRSTELSEEELGKFISRQIVETGQSSKMTIESIKRAFGNDLDVVYVKGATVSDFRSKHGMLKSRSVNDFHHAEDAYLNVVAGNVYDMKFTRNPTRFLRTGERYNISEMYRWDIIRNNKYAWKSGENGTLSTVSKYMGRNNILFTRHSFLKAGRLYEDTTLRKGANLQPLKANLDTEKYGGKSGVTTAYFTVFDCKKGKKTERIIDAVPLFLSEKSGNDETLIRYFSDKYGADDIKIVVPMLKIGTLLEIDGKRVHITGSSEGRILVSNAFQLIINPGKYEYCRKIEKFLEKGANAVNIERFGFSAKANQELYRFFMERMERKPYAGMLDSLQDHLKALEEDFSKAAIETQLKVLNQILIGFQCNRMVTNLSDIGGFSNLNNIRYSNKVWLKGRKSFKIINQSPTGLFETEMDIFKT